MDGKLFSHQEPFESILHKMRWRGPQPRRASTPLQHPKELELTEILGIPGSRMPLPMDRAGGRIGRRAAVLRLQT